MKVRSMVFLLIPAAVGVKVEVEVVEAAVEVVDLQRQHCDGTVHDDLVYSD
jgi:hypothetical protein